MSFLFRLIDGYKGLEMKDRELNNKFHSIRS